jgi:hypothetical protein
MKKQAFVILTTLSLFVILTATTVYAQSDSALVANIPFEFVIGNKTFPAGEYTVRYTYRSVIQILSRDRGACMFVSTGLAKGGKKIGSELVFNRYGDQYFLSTLWRAGDVGRAVSMSRSERELIQARSTSAKSSSGPQMVSVVIVVNKR